MAKSDPDNWQRVQEILRRAFGLDATDRASLVAAECGDDAELRAEVESLLRCDNAAHDADFMDEPLCRLGVIESTWRPPSESPRQSNESIDAQQHAAESIPSQIDRYAVIRELGSGAFGTVVLAHDPKLDRDVAVKVQRSQFISQSEHDVSYDREGRILAKLDHSNIVPVYDTGRFEDGRTYVVSKFIEGTSLAEMLRRGKLSARDAALLIASIADALQHAHRKKLVHRDVKPANILLDEDQNPYLSDFGLTLSNEEFGNYRFQGCTPAYASPEQAAGEGHRVNGQSDIFSLGVVFYEMLTGERPFHGRLPPSC